VWLRSGCTEIASLTLKLRDGIWVVFIILGSPLMGYRLIENVRNGCRFYHSGRILAKKL
jgi:hypothetical protein